MTTPYDGSNFDRAFVITASAGLIQGPTNSEGKPIPYCSAFMTDTDGTVTVEPKNGPSVTPVVIPVIKGVLVRLGIRRLTNVSTAMVVTGFL